MKALTRILLIGALSALTATAGAHRGVGGLSPEVAAPPDVAASPPATSSARDLTLLLVSAKNAHASAAPGQQAKALADLLAVASDRRAELAALAETDPAEFMTVALPASMLAEFPSQAQQYLEQSADEEGSLETFHVDGVEPGSDKYVYYLNTANNGRFSLQFAAKAPTLLTGTKVRVHGSKIDKTLVAADGGSVVVLQAVSVLSNTLGAQKTLAILVNFSDAPTQPYTVAYAQTVMFTTTSNFDYENSYQQTTLAGTVAGWFTIATTSTTCDTSAIASQAQKAAAAAGYVLSNYNRYVYVFPSNACSWWGMGSVGGNPSQAWIHTKWGFTLPVIGHEMGHNFGLYHSHSLDCGAASVAASGCSMSEYGDIFDMMGGGYDTPHFNAFQKERLGWLNAGVSPPLTTVAATPGTTSYTISPLENLRDGTSRALKIPRGNSCTGSNEWFYVEARQGKGFDAFLSSNANMVGGVVVHKVVEGDANSSDLLDMTPATSAWTDPALMAGQSFTDPLSGLVIKPTSVGATGAQVSVTFGGASCARANPAVSLTPTGTVWTSDGATTSYSVSVTNKDGCGCASTPFDVSAAVPTGWSASSARTASIAPGGTTSTSLLVTTAATASAAFYPVTVKSANSSAPTYVASANGTIAVATAVATTVATDKASYTLPTKRSATIYATITTKVTSSGTAVSGAAVSVAVKDSAGKITNLSATTGAAGTATVSFAMKVRTTPKGTYTVTSKATMGTMTSTGTTTFVLN